MLLNSLISVFAGLAIQSKTVVIGSPQLLDSPSHAARSLASTATPRLYKYLVLPVRFATQDSTYSVDSLAKSFDGKTPWVSVRRYFQEQSEGKIDVSFQFLPWMLSSIPRDSFGAVYRAGGSGSLALMKEAVPYIQSKGVDLAEFDNNRDGMVDGLIVVLAGFGNQETLKPTDPRPGIVLMTGNPVINGVGVRKFIRMVELEGKTSFAQAVVIHEMTHGFGAPDLYDQNESIQGDDGGVGYWDVMSCGTSKFWVSREADSLRDHKPTGLSAFTRTVLGWIQPKEIESAQEVRLKPGEAVKVWIDSLRTTEYLMVENRNRSGVDSIMPGPGLLAMRVRTEKLVAGTSELYEELNSDSSEMGVELLDPTGEQRTRAIMYAEPLRQDLFGVSVDSLTDNGLVSLRRSGGRPSGAWIRQIRIDGDDIVFQANSAPRRGYSMVTTKQNLLNGEFGNEKFTIVIPMRISETGNVVALTSVIPQTASTTCVGIWDALPDSGLGAPLATACDTGGFIARLRMFHHDLKTPISVKAGQTVWVGQTIVANGGNTNFSYSSVDPNIDTSWICPSSETGCNFVTARPYVGVLVQTDAPVSSVAGREVGPIVEIRRYGAQLRLFGGRAGETLRLVYRDLNGRVLLSGSATCDANGSALLEIPSGGAGMVLVEARGSFGNKVQILSKP